MIDVSHLLDDHPTPVPSPDELVGASCLTLRPITPDDFGFPFSVATSPRNAFTWRFRGHMPTMSQFVSSLEGSVLVQCVVVERQSGQRLGHVVAYNADLRSRHCYVGVVMDESQIGLRAGREALSLFIDYLFGVWGLRKVYAEVPSFVFEGVERGVHGARINDLFEHEGCLREHLFVAGRHYDVHIVSASAVRWESLKSVRDAWNDFESD